MVGRWAQAERRALFVGNGYLLRDVAHHADAASNFYLFGGMGLATATAVGYAATDPSSRAAVLEGDGNFFMGLAGTAFCASSGLDIVHVVYANGMYESSGGQPLRCELGGSRAPTLARGLGYSWVGAAYNEHGLAMALSACHPRSGTALIWVGGAPEPDVSPRPRPGPVEIADRFSSWARAARASGQGLSGQAETRHTS